ncbi:ABC transporter permease [bacterium]|nr:ABC transporter permease [bacterium]
MFASFLTGAVAMGVVYLFGCIGETLIEKAGNLNLGIPGIMSLGALGGAIGVNLYFAIFGTGDIIGIFLMIIAIIMSGLFAALGGLLYAFLTVTLQANQNVTGLVLTTFGVGFMKFIGSSMDQSLLTRASRSIKTLFTFYEDLGVFGQLFFSYGFLVYLAFILAITLHFVLKKTKVGLFLRSVGESPQTADAQGINVTVYKYSAILIGSAIAGLGGLYYVMDRSGGTTFVEANIEAFGWLSVALVIFSMWKPTIGMVGSIIFGGLTILPNYLGISNVQLKLFAMLPYIFTVIVLIVTSILDAKTSKPPQGLGINYFREER